MAWGAEELVKHRIRTLQPARSPIRRLCAPTKARRGGPERVPGSASSRSCARRLVGRGFVGPLRLHWSEERRLLAMLDATSAPSRWHQGRYALPQVAPPCLGQHRRLEDPADEEGLARAPTPDSATTLHVDWRPPRRARGPRIPSSAPSTSGGARHRTWEVVQPHRNVRAVIPLQVGVKQHRAVESAALLHCECSTPAACRMASANDVRLL
jgi:hypothetical protein